MAQPDVEAVLFDLDDTLCTFVQSSETLLADSFTAVDVEPFFTLSEYQARYSDYLDESDTVEALRADCFADFAAERGHDRETGRALAAAYSELRDYTVEPRPGAAAVVETLAETYTLGLVTNGRPSIQQPKLDDLGFVDHFETVVFGGHEVPAKPSPEPFHLALDDLGVDPGRAVYVGDSLESDVAGAHAAGIASIWVAPDDGADPDPRPDYSVSSLQQLVPPPWM